MDYDALRAGMAEAIPYNTHIGLELEEVGEGKGIVALPEADNLKNHVGSQHAGALFSAGEAASGATFVGAFAEHLGGLTPLARTAEISYLKIARGRITATATLEADSAELLATIESEGRVDFPVGVELTDGDGQVVARMSVGWHVRQNQA